MKKKNKLINIIIIMIFIGACFVPNITGYHVDNKNKYKQLYQQNSDDELIEVTVFGLDKNLRIIQSKKNMQIKEYDIYRGEIISSNSLSESYRILKKYDIIDDTITEVQFTEFMNKLSKFYQKTEGMLNILKQNNNINFDQIEGVICPIKWQFNPPVQGFYIPGIYLKANTNNGGSVNIVWQYLHHNIIYVEMFFYLGLLLFNPFNSVREASFWGFAVYCKAY